MLEELKPIVCWAPTQGKPVFPPHASSLRQSADQMRTQDRMRQTGALPAHTLILLPCSHPGTVALRACQWGFPREGKCQPADGSLSVPAVGGGGDLVSDAISLPSREKSHGASCRWKGEAAHPRPCADRNSGFCLAGRQSRAPPHLSARARPPTADSQAAVKGELRRERGYGIEAAERDANTTEGRGQRADGECCILR